MRTRRRKRARKKLAAERRKGNQLSNNNKAVALYKGDVNLKNLTMSDLYSASGMWRKGGIDNQKE